MSDIIHLLPDSIANQIAAGEVIQRPASVVKELVENAIDAGATHIQIIIKDAGRTSIQVIDNGKGMSETDARMAFERHATSKISKAEDLYALRTMGFRGEALASIVAVAHVELKTRNANNEVGTLLVFSGSELEKQEVIATSQGSSFTVKNLFFNIPVRRKFLKSNETEFRNILTEFERIALVNPGVSFTLIHNDTEIFNLPESVLRQRIVNILGKGLNQSLLSLHVETSLARISGFIGTPSSARKRGALQYFFVNNRYMKHPYFHRAVMLAFEPFIPAGEMPNYFIYIDIDPSAIDVNIHPTKTEIKFENEQAIWQIITASVKEAIGKANAVPSIEFNQEGAINIPVYDREKVQHTTTFKPTINSNYNPFKSSETSYQKPNKDWEKLYEFIDNPQETSKQTFTEIKTDDNHPELFETTDYNYLQYKGKYLITPLKSGLILIHQRRAHIRILFEDYLQRMQNKQGLSQGLLFPEIIRLTSKEASIMPVIIEDLSFIGFDIADLGSNDYSINGIPSGLEKIDPVETIQDMIARAMETGCEVKEEICEALALSLAKQAAIPFGKPMSDEEANQLIGKLFSSAAPNYTPDGQIIISILSDEEFEKRFK